MNFKMVLTLKFQDKDFLGIQNDHKQTLIGHFKANKKKDVIKLVSFQKK